jgi:hypothetical protein
METFKSRAVDYAKRYPLFGYLLRLANGNPWGSVTKYTEICIEGFPRSANTFAVHLVRAFLIKEHPVFFSANAESLIAHHTHAIGSLKSSLRRRVPTFILVRKPRDAIASFAVRDSHMSNRNIERSLERGVKRYSNFYKFVNKKREKFEIVSFETITKFPGPFIKEIGHSLCLEVPKKIDTKSLKSFAKKSVKKRIKLTKANDMEKAIPSEKRKKVQRRVKSRLHNVKNINLAERIYSDLIKHKIRTD